jgi:dTDP-4-amino-4,6-dideoxygalactose transaminase
LTESERAQDEVIILPLFHQLTDADQIRVAETLITALRR